MYLEKIIIKLIPRPLLLRRKRADVPSLFKRGKKGEFD